MAPQRYAAKFDPFLSLECAFSPSTLAHSNERKRSNLAIWQPCTQGGGADSPDGNGNNGSGGDLETGIGETTRCLNNSVDGDVGVRKDSGSQG